MGYKPFQEYFSSKKKEINKQIESEKAIRDLQRMKEDPNYDPINEKDYSAQAGVGPFEKNYEEHRKTHGVDGVAIEDPNEVPEEYGDIEDIYDYYNKIDEEEIDEYCQQTAIDQFSNEDSLSNFIDNDPEENNFENDPDPLDLNRFRIRKEIEDEGKKEKKIKDKKEFAKNIKKIKNYTEFEKTAIKNNVENYLKNGKQPIEGRVLSLKQEKELLDEYRLLYPEDFARAINQKIITAEMPWKKETFNGKEILVSYWPNPNNPKMKYVLNLDGEKNPMIEKNERMKVVSSINKDGKSYRSRDGVILIFCSRLKEKK